MNAVEATAGHRAAQPRETRVAVAGEIGAVSMVRAAVRSIKAEREASWADEAFKTRAFRIRAIAVVVAIGL